MTSSPEAAWLSEETLERFLAEIVAESFHAAATRAEEIRALVHGCAEGDVEPGDLGALATVAASSLDGVARVELVQALERMRAVVDGLQQVALASVVEATAEQGLAGEFARWEVAAALRLSQGAADRRTAVAQEMTQRLPRTLEALRTGRISYLQAATLVEAVTDLSDEAAADVETRVLRRASKQTVAETRRAIARAVLAVDPEGARERSAAASRTRRIERHPQPDAMEGWWMTLPASLASRLWEELSRRASVEQQRRRDAAEDDPGLAALRVDALLSAVLGATQSCAPTQDNVTPTTEPHRAADSPPEPRGAAGSQPEPCGTATPPAAAPGTAAVVIDLPTLLGLAENPGELPGYGPIPADLARELARDLDWIRWTVDPGTRQLLDRGALRYRPSERLRAFLVAAHRTCGFPGCSRRAELCDLDHAVAFRRHGRTVVRNLGPLCRQHHNAKTSGHWRLEYDDDTGCKTWTSPLGKTYVKSVDPILE